MRCLLGVYKKHTVVPYTGFEGNRGINNRRHMHMYHSSTVEESHILGFASGVDVQLAVCKGPDQLFLTCLQ